MFSDLKDRASKAKDAGVTRISRTRDHMKSQPSKNINWDKAPPPPPPPVARARNTFAPPPPRSSSAVSHSPVDSEGSASSPISPSAAAPPPFVRRPVRPDSGPPPPPPTRSVVSSSPSVQPDRIDWANLSQEDKEVFFSWLDEFFARFLNTPVPKRGVPSTINDVEESVRSPYPALVPPRAPPSAGPPPVPKWTRPTQASPAPSVANDVEQFTMSYPPQTQHGSSALDLAYYFLPSVHWDTPWYAGSDPHRPPPLRSNQQIRWTGHMHQRGSTKTVYSGFMFADLSMCWFSVSFPVDGLADPNDSRLVERNAEYIPRPSPMDRAALLDAHETYGETVAGFAESFEGTGQYCAQGECWDLAHQALEYFAQFDYVPKPVPSTNRTHGHLIFEGKATGVGRPQYGRWRGGDDRVRRGDIVEFRSGKITKRTATRIDYMTLGSPEHTAVIVRDAIPAVPVADGQSVRPDALGELEVVDQAVRGNVLPRRITYDLRCLEEGEVWIYRPVGLQAYVGCSLEAKRPEGIQAQRI